MSSILEWHDYLTKQTVKHPYNLEIYLNRATCHEALGFPDLAAGDAYKALLLIDEIQDTSSEYHVRALQALSVDRTVVFRPHEPEAFVDTQLYRLENTRWSADGIQPLLTTLSLKCYQILASNLAKCGCLRSAYDFCERGLYIDAKNEKLQASKDDILTTFKNNDSKYDSCLKIVSFDPKKDLPDNGFVRREIYPWNIYEPDRLADSSLSVLNEELKKVASKCSVQTISLPLLTKNNIYRREDRTVEQLALFATDDISPGETILFENTLLTANNRLYGPLCDACSSELPGISFNLEVYKCGSCDDTVFCSQTCMEDALTKYHPAVCGKDVETIGRDTESKEAVESLYMLLLARVMALAETQGQHPLDLKETKFIWGDFVYPHRTYLPPNPSSLLTTVRQLPFSFKYNILNPLHVLEKMEIDFFAEVERYDFWIFNTLYAKFRGTASGRLDTLDGRPEVSAVHPMWSLANHSCAPNVKWEWAGKISLKARVQDEIVSWGSKEEKDHYGGIKKGDEIVNHYCDVELPVQTRRQWAIGALGGACTCDRCVWETEEISKCNDSRSDNILGSLSEVGDRAWNTSWDS